MIGNIIVLTKKIRPIQGQENFLPTSLSVELPGLQKVDLVFAEIQLPLLYSDRCSESNKHFNAQAYGFNFLLSLNSASCQRNGNKIFQIFGFKARLRVASYCIASSF